MSINPESHVLKKMVMEHQFETKETKETKEAKEIKEESKGREESKGIEETKGTQKTRATKVPKATKEIKETRELKETKDIDSYRQVLDSNQIQEAYLNKKFLTVLKKVVLSDNKFQDFQLNQEMESEIKKTEDTFHQLEKNYSEWQSKNFLERKKDFPKNTLPKILERYFRIKLRAFHKLLSDCTVYFNDITELQRQLEPFLKEATDEFSKENIEKIINLRKKTMVLLEKLFQNEEDQKTILDRIMHFPQWNQSFLKNKAEVDAARKEQIAKLTILFENLNTLDIPPDYFEDLIKNPSISSSEENAFLGDPDSDEIQLDTQRTKVDSDIKEMLEQTPSKALYRIEIEVRKAKLQGELDKVLSTKDHLTKLILHVSYIDLKTNTITATEDRHLSYCQEEHLTAQLEVNTIQDKAIVLSPNRDRRQGQLKCYMREDGVLELEGLNNKETELYIDTFINVSIREGKFRCAVLETNADRLENHATLITRLKPLKDFDNYGCLIAKNPLKIRRCFNYKNAIMMSRQLLSLDCQLLWTDGAILGKYFYASVDTLHIQPEAYLFSEQDMQLGVNRLNSEGRIISQSLGLLIREDFHTIEQSQIIGRKNLLIVSKGTSLHEGGIFGENGAIFLNNNTLSKTGMIHVPHLLLRTVKQLNCESEIVSKQLTLQGLAGASLGENAAIIGKRTSLLFQNTIQNQGYCSALQWANAFSFEAIHNGYNGHITGKGFMEFVTPNIFENLGEFRGGRLTSIDALTVLNAGPMQGTDIHTHSERTYNQDRIIAKGMGEHHARDLFENKPNAEMMGVDTLLIQTEILHNQHFVTQNLKPFLERLKISKETEQVVGPCMRALKERKGDPETLLWLKKLTDWALKLPSLNPCPEYSEQLQKLTKELLNKKSKKYKEEEIGSAKLMGGHVELDTEQFLNDGFLIASENMVGHIKQFKNEILASLQVLQEMKLLNLDSFMNAGRIEAQTADLNMKSVFENLEFGLISIQNKLTIEAEKVGGKNLGKILAHAAAINFKATFQNAGLISVERDLLLKAAECLENLKSGKIQSRENLNLLSSLKIFTEGEILAHAMVSMKANQIETDGKIESKNKMALETLHWILKGELQAAEEMVLTIINQWDWISGKFNSKKTEIQLKNNHILKKEVEHVGRLTFDLLPHNVLLNKTRVKTIDGDCVFKKGHVDNGDAESFGRIHAINAKVLAEVASFNNRHGGIFGEKSISLQHQETSTHGTLVYQSKNGRTWITGNGSYVASGKGAPIHIKSDNGLELNAPLVKSGGKLDCEVANHINNTAGHLEGTNTSFTGKNLYHRRLHQYSNNNESCRVTSDAATLLSHGNCDLQKISVNCLGSYIVSEDKLLVPGKGHMNVSGLEDFDTEKTTTYIPPKKGNFFKKVSTALGWSGQSQGQYIVTKTKRLIASYPSRVAARTSIEGGSTSANFTFDSPVQTNRLDLKFATFNIGGKPLASPEGVWIDNFLDFFPNTPLFREGGDPTSQAVVSPEVPLAHQPVFSKACLADPRDEDLPFYFDERIEMFILDRIFMERLGKTYLETVSIESQNEKSCGFISTLFDELRSNAFAFAKEKSLSLEDLKTSKIPIIYYTRLVINNKAVLVPMVVIPTSYAFNYGVSAKEGNLIGGVLNITGKASFEDKLDFELDYLKIQQQTVEETFIAHYRRQAAQLLTQSWAVPNTGVLEAGQIKGLTQRLYQRGGLIHSKKWTDIKIIKEAICNALRTQVVLQGSRDATIMPEFSPACMISLGSQKIYVTEGGFGGMGFVSQAGTENKLKAREGVRIQPIGEDFALPTEKERRKTIKQKDTAFLQSEFIAGTKATLKSEKEVHLTSLLGAAGTTMEVEGQKVLLDTMSTNKITQVKGTRQRGFKVTKYREKVTHKNPLLSTLVVGEDLIIKAKERIELAGVKGLIGHNFITQAPETRIRGAKAQTIIENNTESYGVSFFGSQALEALGRGEGRQALKHLARSHGFIDAVSELAKARRTGDKAGVNIGLVKTFIEGWRTASMVSQACNSNAPFSNLLGGLTDQLGLTTVTEDGTRIFNPRISFEFGKNKQKTTHTQTVSSEFEVGNTVDMSGDVIRLNDGMEISTKNIYVAATKFLEMTSAENTVESQGRSHTIGVSATVIDPAIVGGSVGFSKSSFKGTQHKLGNIRASNEMKLISEHVRVHGTDLEALDLAVTANHFEHSAPQNTTEGKSSSVGVSVSTSTAGFSLGGEKERSQQTVRTSMRANVLDIRANHLTQTGTDIVAKEKAIFMARDHEGPIDHKVNSLHDYHDKSSYSFSASMSLAPLASKLFPKSEGSKKEEKEKKEMKELKETTGFKDAKEFKEIKEYKEFKETQEAQNIPGPGFKPRDPFPAFGSFAKHYTKSSGMSHPVVQAPRTIGAVSSQVKTHVSQGTTLDPVKSGSSGFAFVLIDPDAMKNDMESMQKAWSKLTQKPVALKKPEKIVHPVEKDTPQMAAAKLKVQHKAKKYENNKKIVINKIQHALEEAIEGALASQGLKMQHEQVSQMISKILVKVPTDDINFLKSYLKQEMPKVYLFALSYAKNVNGDSLSSKEMREIQSKDLSEFIKNTNNKITRLFSAESQKTTRQSLEKDEKPFHATMLRRKPPENVSKTPVKSGLVAFLTGLEFMADVIYDSMPSIIPEAHADTFTPPQEEPEPIFDKQHFVKNFSTINAGITSIKKMQQEEFLGLMPPKQKLRESDSATAKNVVTKDQNSKTEQINWRKPSQPTAYLENNRNTLTKQNVSKNDSFNNLMMKTEGVEDTFVNPSINRQVLKQVTKPLTYQFKPIVTLKKKLQEGFEIGLKRCEMVQEKYNIPSTRLTGAVGLSRPLANFVIDYIPSSPLEITLAASGLGAAKKLPKAANLIKEANKVIGPKLRSEILSMSRAINRNTSKVLKYTKHKAIDLGNVTYDKSIPILRKYDNHVHQMGGSKGWRYVRNTDAGRKIPVKLSPTNVGKIREAEKVYNSFMKKYFNINQDVSGFNKITQELISRRAVNRVKDQMKPETLAARLKELDGHKIYKDARVTSHEDKLYAAINKSRELIKKIDIQIDKFQKNGHAKPGEIEYLKQFSKDLKSAVNKFSDIGEISCQKAKLTK